MPALGRLCLVLHAHIPYVLHHGVWPHGEAWLYEAAAETYLPLLQLLDELNRPGTHFTLTLGLTPVLLEQLADDYFKSGFVQYLHERTRLARHDAVEFYTAERDDLATLARRWEDFYAAKVRYFDSIGRDIPAAFAGHHHAGRLQILTSAATHAYLPLLGEDGSIRAQLATGIAASEKHLGFRSTGLWLPECAYRPAAQQWQPPVLYRPPRFRPGLEKAIGCLGLSHFFVDTHLVTHGKPVAVTGPGGLRAVNDATVFWDNKRGWGSPLDPVGVAGDSPDDPPVVFAFARHPDVSEQVWSAVSGYPGADDYLEFHRKHGDHGLRYHRVTSHHTPAEEKQPYDPGKIAGKTYEHAQHFCGVVRETLTDYTARTGRLGTIVAPFDAELFGHWWFEGFDFLKNVLLTLTYDGAVVVTSPESVLNENPPDKVMKLPEGSWGEGGGHDVWLNPKTEWLWETAYRAEDRFVRLVAALPWRENADVKTHLEKAARELLLLQSSDWPFVIRGRAAADYGISRFSGHATRFDRLCTVATDAAAGREITPIQRTEIAEADAHDTVFAEIDLTMWDV